MTSWPTVTLNNLRADEPRAITDGPFGSHLARAHYTEAGPRVVRLQNIGDGSFVDAKAHISQEHFESLRGHAVQAGDLLIASLGEILPRACLAPNWLGPAIVKADCIRVRLHPNVEPRWVLYSLQRPSVRRWADEHRHGVGRPRLGLKVIRQIPIPLPDRREQRRIVDILEGHLSRLDAAENYLAVSGSRAARWAMSALEALVWNHAERRPVGELLREPMRNGYSGRAVRGNESGVRTLTLTAVTRDSFVDEYTKIALADPQRVKNLWLKPGDLFVQRSNTPDLVGSSALYKGPEHWAVFPDLMIRLRADRDLVEPGYLAAALRSESGHRQLKSRSKGLAGSMPKIDQGAIAAVGIPVPTIGEQHRIVGATDALREKERRLLGAMKAGRTRSDGLRRALLTAAFSGQLTGHASDLERVEEMAAT